MRVALEPEGDNVKILVAYASHKGNTRRVAEHIVEALQGQASIELIDVEEAPHELPEAQLVFVGGPTEGHGMTREMDRYLDNLVTGALAGRTAAAFDTRLSWPRFLSGSAAMGIARRLRAAGAEVVVEPESFIVSTAPDLLPGELERVGAWAREVFAKAEAALVVPAR